MGLWEQGQLNSLLLVPQMQKISLSGESRVIMTHILKLINTILIGQCKCKENSVLSSYTRVTFGYFKENSEKTPLKMRQIMWIKQ